MIFTQCKQCDYCAIYKTHMAYTYIPVQKDILFLHDQYIDHPNPDKCHAMYLRFSGIINKILEEHTFLGKQATKVWGNSFVIRTNKILKDGTIDLVSQKELTPFIKTQICVDTILRKELDIIQPKLIFNFGTHTLGIQHLLGKIPFLAKGDLYRKDGIFYVKMFSLDELFINNIRDIYNPSLRAMLLDLTLNISIVSAILEHETINESIEEQYDIF